jgi:hypothetical protein
LAIKRFDIRVRYEHRLYLSGAKQYSTIRIAFKMGAVRERDALRASGPKVEENPDAIGIEIGRPYSPSINVRSAEAKAYSVSGELSHVEDIAPAVIVNCDSRPRGTVEVAYEEVRGVPLASVFEAHPLTISRSPYSAYPDGRQPPSPNGRATITDPKTRMIGDGEGRDVLSKANEGNIGGKDVHVRILSEPYRPGPEQDLHARLRYFERLLQDVVAAQHARIANAAGGW